MSAIREPSAGPSDTGRVKVWVDAQMSPAIASWLRSTYDVEALAVRDVGLRDATDREIFFAARAAKAVVMTKDGDFVDLVNHHGSPPQILWVTCGNTSNTRLKEILTHAWPSVTSLLAAGERVIEIGDRTS